VVGVLLSIAVGMLALEVAKITAFLSAGTAAWVAAQAVMPQAQELWAVFLCGGLLGVVLYRLWTMLATSLVGVLLFWHALFVLLDATGLVVAAEFAVKHAVWLNAALVTATVVGVGVQSWTAKAPASVEDKSDEKAEKAEKKPKGKPALAAAA
jgi:K+-sensing histidine kinase KdpD